MALSDSSGSLRSYILDTSSIMAIPYQFPHTKDTIWNGITRLIEAGRLKSIELVIEELKRHAVSAENAHVRLEPYKDCLLIPWHPLLTRAGVIAHDCSYLSPPNNPRLKADPFIIAAAEVHNLTVVCDESYFHRRKMPAACQQFHVPCVRLLDFVSDENLELG